MVFDRRSLLKAGLALPAITSMSALAGLDKSVDVRPLLKPKRLVKGMTVGLIAPASNARENEDIRFAIEVVQSLGFKVKFGKHLFARNNYLAGTDRERAEDVNAMFADTAVGAIFCLRGGYGSPRILPLLDYKMIQRNPKILLGYSDITALLLAINRKCGMMTYHGPIAKQNFSDYTLSEFKKVLMRPSSNSLIGAPPVIETREGFVEKRNRLTRISSGRARGTLLGGNLSLITKLIGTPYEPDFRGKILVLEDVGEQPYRIDGMLTHLWLAGKLQQCAGIVFGKFTDTESEGGENSFSLEEIFQQRCQPLQIPVLRGLMVGHVKDQTVLPIGAGAELDVEKGTLTLLETAVI